MRFWSGAGGQKESHGRSQEEFARSDPDMRARNVLACRSWRGNNREYWRNRRENNPGYTKHNVELQRRRDRRDLANTDSIKLFQREKLKRIGILIHLANTESITVPWTTVSEEIRLYLKWQMRLANTNSIAGKAVDTPQSRA